MAENRTINIDINQNAEEAAKGFNSLNNALDETNKSVRDVNKTFEEVYGDLQPLTTRLGEAEDRLYELAAAGQTTTQEYKDLLQTVANYRQIQIQTDAVVDAAATRFDEKLGGALQGAASGFAGVQGAMALFGDESEALEKTLVKLQGAMALAEGVRGVREGLLAFNQLKTGVVLAFQSMTTASKAFLAGGIGLVITGVALAAANWEKLTGAIRKNKEEQKLNNEVMTQAVSSIAKELSAADKLQKQLKDENLTREEKRKKVAAFQKEYPNILSNIDAEKTSIEGINIALTKNIGLLKLQAQAKAIQAVREKTYTDLVNKQLELATGAAKEEFSILGVEIGGITYGEDAANGILGFADANEAATIRTNEATDALNKQITALDKMDADISRQIAALQKQGAVIKSENTSASKSTATSTKERINYARQLEKERIDAMEDGMEKRIKLLEYERAGELKDIDKTGKKAGELRKAIEARYAKEIEKVKYEFRDRSDRDDEINLEKKIATRISTGKLELEAEEAIRTQIYQMNLEQDEKDKARIKQLNEYRVQAVKDGLQTISNLAELFAGKSEKQQKRAFQVQKAVNIANAVIDTYKAANTALASSPPPFNYIAMAAAITAGLVNVKKIASQQFQSSSSSSGGGGTPSAPEVAQAAPQFNTIGSSGINQLAQLQQQPVQAYVVSGEVTSAQALDRNRIQNATL